MSAVPAFVVGTLCIVGGVIGYVRTRSIPSIVAGIGIGAMYLSSGDSIRKDVANGLETALGTSVLLFLSSLPRFSKGPIPAMLTVTSAVTGVFYWRLVYEEYR